MNIDFDRYKAQIRCEEFVDCSDNLPKWASSRKKFEGLSLNKSQSILYSNDLRTDAIDLYSKGIHTFFVAINALLQPFSSHSWATIQLYYSIHYFLRASLASRGLGLIRNGGLYCLRDTLGANPTKKNSKDYQTTHSGVIYYFIDNYLSSDILLSNDIDDQKAYVWYKELREILNYSICRFDEPKISQFWEYANSKLKSGLFNELLKDYAEDTFVLCFQQDHAVLALPIKRALLTQQDLKAEAITPNFSMSELDYLKGLLGYTNTPTYQNVLLELLE